MSFLAGPCLLKLLANASSTRPTGNIHMVMDLSLAGRVALVTGAARGIGLATARQLVSQDAQVLMADLSPDIQEIAKALGPQAQGLVADVSLEDDVQRLVAQAGAVDILVNNAAIFPLNAGRKFKVEETTTDAWQNVMGVNLNSAFFLARALVPGMAQKGWGRIINVSSQAGRGRSDQTSAHYVTSKAALLGLTRSLAGELAPQGINVTAVAPGFIETEMTGLYSPEIRQAMIATIPVRRVGTPQDIANMIGYLASPASSFVNGAIIDVNGGGYM
jgi:3-oxoacyl-[acyl-carrier protein] reductase